MRNPSAGFGAGLFSGRSGAVLLAEILYNTLKRPHAWLNLTFNFVSRLSVAAWNCRCGVLVRTFTVTMFLLFLAVNADAQTSQLCIYENVGKAAKISETIESVVPIPKE